MKTFVITGSTGNIGGKLTAILAKQGHCVKAITRHRQNAPHISGVEFIEGALDDVDFLEKTFRGADAVFCLIPPDYVAKSFRGSQNIFSDAITQAIKNAGVKYVVNLSSLGAEYSEHVGPIKGLHDHEQRLNRLSDINVVHLRAAYFFENTLFGAELVKTHGIFGTAVKPDVKFSHVATKDIASTAAKYLTELSFVGKNIVEVISEPSTTMHTIAETLSGALAKPVPYVAFSYEGTKEALVASGLSEDVADEFVELYDAMNKGLIKSHGYAEKNLVTSNFKEFIQTVKGVFV